MPYSTLCRALTSSLQDLARQIRARRFDDGALRIDNVKVSFSLGANGIPEDCTSFERKEANELIEEVSRFVFANESRLNNCGSSC